MYHQCLQLGHLDEVGLLAICCLQRLQDHQLGLDEVLLRKLGRNEDQCQE